MTFEHFIITRFNLPIYDRTKAGAVSSTNVEYLRRRFEIFEKFCLPSIQRQSCQNFKWIVLFDENTPVEFKERIRFIQSQYNKLIPCYLNLKDYESPDEQYMRLYEDYIAKLSDGDYEDITNNVKEYNRVIVTPAFVRDCIVNNLDACPEYIITTRIDNDDALHKDFIKIVQEESIIQKRFVLLDYICGYRLNLFSRTVCKYRYPSGHFTSLLEPNGRVLYTAMYWVHNVVDKCLPVLHLEREPLYIELVHELNVINEEKQNSFKEYLYALIHFKASDFGYPSDSLSIIEMLNRIMNLFWSYSCSYVKCHFRIQYTRPYNFVLYKLKSIVYSVLPSFIRGIIENRKTKRAQNKLIVETVDRDVKRLLRYGFSYNHTPAALLKKLRMLTHFIEKGLTMPDPRPCFGIMRLEQIAEVVEQLGIKYREEFEMQYISHVLDEYVEFHEKRNVPLPDLNRTLVNRIKMITGCSTCDFDVSQRHYTKELYFTVKDGMFKDIAESRHSIRNYIDLPIPDSIFVDVAKVASTAPSACNRQPCKMHVVKDKYLKDQVLSLGVGCNGFGHLASAIIIVTSDLECRDNIVERHQVGVDAGFFGMNLLYALHEKKIGACVLNWDNLKNADKQLRSLIPCIKDNETVLFIVSCGYTPDEFDIPLGLKININNVVDFV